MSGFRFNGIHSNDFDIIVKSDDRTVLPSKRVTKYEIPGRDGIYESDAITYENRIITVTITFNGDDYTANALRERVRTIAKWLSKKGQLIFDDEPDKAYQAQVTDGISISQLTVWGECDISFDCQPFAESINYITTLKEITAQKDDVDLTVQGTQDTPCIIILKNTGTTNISGIKITRKADD